VQRPVHVTKIFVYPIKSCAGIGLERAEAGPRGFLHDREWMVVDGEGRFVTQRTEPRLALVRVRLEGDALEAAAPGRPVLRVPLDRTGGPRRRVVVWNDTCDAVSEGPEAARWFSALLGMPCELVRMAAGAVRPVDPARAGPGRQVGFADAFPFLLLSEASLEGLNARLGRPLPVNRFRPNLVVSGCPPHAEDEWRRIRVGDVVLRVVKPCARCVITTVDQETGVAGKEPLATLATYRRRGNAVLFGQNLVHENTGTVRVGDPVEILE
jgi:Uncharacterized Fe-S protein